MLKDLAQCSRDSCLERLLLIDGSTCNQSCSTHYDTDIDFFFFFKRGGGQQHRYGHSFMGIFPFTFFFKLSWGEKESKNEKTLLIFHFNSEILLKKITVLKNCFLKNVFWGGSDLPHLPSVHLCLGWGWEGVALESRLFLY